MPPPHTHTPPPPTPQPNFYINKEGRSGNEYVGCCFIRDFREFASHLACPGGQEGPACRLRQFAGPVWGHVFMYPSTMNWFLR